MATARVYCWGFGKEGELANGKMQNEMVPKEVLCTDGDFISVECGNYCTFAVTRHGRIYGWGKADKIRLGIQVNVPTISIPTLIATLKGISIVKISCGNSHSLAVSNDGSLYGWGNGTKGQLTNQLTRAENVPTKLSLTFGSVKDVACGCNCSFAISEDNILYSWGSNDNFLLGRPIKEPRDEQIPNPVRMPPVLSVSCGALYIGAITDNNQLFMWGSNKKGELGLGFRSAARKAPTKVPAFDGYIVSQVSCGQSNTHQHTLAITKSPQYQVWAWGDGYKNQLGIPGIPVDSFLQSPKEIDFFRNMEVQEVFAGGIHSLALCEGIVYSWGCGSDGRLGHTEASGHRYLYKEIIPRPIGGTNNVTSISCSYYHSACITTSNPK